MEKQFFKKWIAGISAVLLAANITIFSASASGVMVGIDRVTITLNEDNSVQNAVVRNYAGIFVPDSVTFISEERESLDKTSKIQQYDTTSYTIPIFVRLNDEHEDLTAIEFGVEAPPLEGDPAQISLDLPSPTDIGPFSGELTSGKWGMTWALSEDRGMCWLTQAFDYGNQSGGTNIALVMVTIENPTMDVKYPVVYRSEGINQDGHPSVEIWKNGEISFPATISDGYIEFHQETTPETTTTETTTTTTTTETTTTTTTTTTTETSPAPDSPTTFTECINNWKFSNSHRNFGENYYISEDYLKKLLDGLSRTEQAGIKELLSKNFEGSCYGMACTSILSCYDILKPADYQEKANFLHDIDAPPSKEVQSLINYYFALQETNEVQQYITHALTDLTEEEKIEKLLSQLEDDSPTLLTFYRDSGGGHAVVAYDVEYGSFVIDKQAYNAKVFIYDSNAVDFDDDACMYINTSENIWTIPYYFDANSGKDGKIGMTTDDLYLINYHGYLDGTEKKSTQEYIPVLTSENLDTNFSLRRINLEGDSWSVNSAPDDDIKLFSSFTDEDTPENMKFAVKGNQKGCVLKLKENEPVDMSMRYENDLIQAKSELADEIVFDPSGYAEISGETSAYTLNLTSNDGYAPTDWYEMNASGTASEAKLYKTSDGYIMKADNLENVSLSAKSDNSSPSLKFSTEYSEVLIYEIDENTIGVAVDTDDNGSYETTIAKTEPLKQGDADGDDNISILDVILVNRAILGKSSLTAEQVNAVDFNKNGYPEPDEALMIMKYIVKIIDNFS